ncbi:MAG TPA: alpha/beta fold hydrolase [Rhizomicrobium sp.]|nr:alpha/beta fold hydrolase [Rhizomicrobium sp.]
MRKIVATATLLLLLVGNNGSDAHIRADDSRCAKGAVCGYVTRPLDPSGHVSGTIDIYYRLYPHTDQNATFKGTIVAQEGGPGYPSVGTSYDYKLLFAPLRNDHDLLMIDQRGTGKSGALDCPSLQHSPVRTPRDIGDCGKYLGAAADLYGTRLAAQDMAAVLDSLGIGQIDYYGDSYGTFFGQVFSALYPDRVRSMVLDGAYPVIGETPWYGNSAAVVRHSFNDSCERAPYCASLKGTYLGRIRKLLDAVRKTPITGDAPDNEGKIRTVTADPGTLGNMLLDGTQGPINYRDLDAAIRAYFTDGDSLPLLRLVAENNDNEDPSPPKSYSYGLFSAVSCMDYQQIYNMDSPVGERHKERVAALDAQRKSDPNIYDPLTIGEYQTIPLDISVLNLCVDWPIHRPPYTPGLPIPKNAKFTKAPVLVINGELDMLTTPAEGDIVTAQYKNAQHVIIANSFHVDALEDVDDCTQEIIRRFVSTLDTGDTSCAANVKPVRLVPNFVQHAADAIPAAPSSGNTASTAQLAQVSAAVQTAGDVIARWNINYSGSGLGLRGGTWTFTQGGDFIANFTMTNVLWTTDLPVSGTARWNLNNGAVREDIAFTDANGEPATLTARWNDRDHEAVATITGTIGSNKISATMPAP